jgi:hypothetical protein
VQLRPFQLQHLDFDAVRERGAGIGIRTAPQEHAGVSAGLGVHPFHVKQVVLILLLGAHYAGRLSGADEHAFFHGPCVRGSVDVHPAREILAVEEVLPFRNSVGPDHPCGQPDPNQ